MNKRLCIRFAILAVGVMIGIVWLVRTKAEKATIYEGMPLESWVVHLRSVEPVKRKKAIEITRKAGTNAVPTLLRMLKERDGFLKSKVMEFIQVQSSYRVRYISSEIRNAAAANACEELGDEAGAAVPLLIELLNHEKLYVRISATNALKRVNPETAAEVGVK